MESLDEILDSTVVIDAMNGWTVAIDFVRSTGRRGISLITWIEVMAGAMPDDEEFHHTFLSDFTVLEVTPTIAAQAARLRRDLKLKLPDAVILATAQVNGCTLVTRNTKDFPEGTPGVRVPYRL